MTDEPAWHIYTFATPFQRDAITLGWSCDAKHMEVYVDLKEYLGSEVHAQYRFDSDTVSRSQAWDFTARTAYAPDDVVRALSARARTAAKLLIRFTASDGESVTYTFDFDGSLKAAERAQMRSMYLDKRGRLSRFDSLMLETTRTGDTLSFAAAYDRLPCTKR